MDNLPPIPSTSDAQQLTAHEIAQQEAILVVKNALETQEVAGEAALNLIDTAIQVGQNIDIFA